MSTWLSVVRSLRSCILSQSRFLLPTADTEEKQPPHQLKQMTMLISRRCYRGEEAVAAYSRTIRIRERGGLVGMSSYLVLVHAEHNERHIVSR